MVAGALYLVDSNAVPGISVNSAIIIPTAVVLGSLMLLVVTVAARATKRRVSSGVEGMIGREIVLDKPLGRKGSLNIEGELWKAELEGYSGGEVPAGERVKVVKVTGLTVLVARA